MVRLHVAHGSVALLNEQMSTAESKYCSFLKFGLEMM